MLIHFSLHIVNTIVFHLVDIEIITVLSDIILLEILMSQKNY